MDGYTTIEVSSDQISGMFYVPANQVQYINSNTLVNSGSSTITLFRDIANSSNYSRERITLNSFSTPVYYSSSSSSGVYLSNASVSSYSFLSQIYKNEYLYSPLLILLIGISIVVRLLKHD